MMSRPFLFQFWIFLLVVVSFGCQSENPDTNGKLFIIGGGTRPPELMRALLDEAQLHNGDYIVILPFASGEPKESTNYVSEQFLNLGAKNIHPIFLNADSTISISALDSVNNAKLVYITGGDQNKFMKTAQLTGLDKAIQNAFINGSTIAGTSAGAAVMSKKMITGNQRMLSKYSGDYKTIYQNNIEIARGLGLMDNAIIDQHFIRRMRMNRLISVAIENPEETCIGIDESTAILVEGNRASVVGSSQVVVIWMNNGAVKTKNGLLGADNLRLSIFVPGDSFKIK